MQSYKLSDIKATTMPKLIFFINKFVDFPCYYNKNYYICKKKTGINGNKWRFFEINPTKAQS